MKAYYTFLIVASSLFIFSQSRGQDSLLYVSMGGESTEEGVRLVSYSDSTFLMLVNSGEVDGTTNSSVHLIHIDEGGEVLASTSYGTQGSDRAYDMVRVGDTLIIGGITNGADLYDYDGFLFFIDLITGELYRERYFDVDGEWSKVSALATKGDSVLAVVEAVQNQTTPSFKLLGLDGETLLETDFSQLDGYEVRRAKHAHVSKRGFLITASTIESPADAKFVRLDNDMAILWETGFSMSGTDVFMDLIELEDSSIAAVGYSSSFNEEDEDILAIKLDSSGALIDTLIQGYDVTVDNKDDRGMGIAQRNDTIYLTGFTNTFSEGGEECFITRIRSNFSLLPNSTTFGTPQSERSLVVYPYKKGAVGIGSTSSQAAGGQNALFWRRAFFNFSTVVEVKKKVPYAIDEFILHNEDVRDEWGHDWINDPLLKSKEVRLYSITGQWLGNYVLSDRSLWSGIVPMGVYILEVEHENGWRRAKIFIP